MSANLLMVEDDPLIRRSAAARLRQSGYRVKEAESVAAAKGALSGDRFDVVVLDYQLPDGTGFELMAEVEVRQPGTPVVMVTGHGSVAHAVEAMRRGASHYVLKPVDHDELEIQIRKATETADLRRENARLKRLAPPRKGADAFLGVSPTAQALREQIRRVAASPARAVLLEGESGTGKGVVARAIHDASPRADRAFVSITCSAMPEQLLESELFGHESGAFTDARKRKIGLLEAAEGGTLFLDEIGDMAAPLQAKLLGILEERRYRRVGGIQEIEADVRVVSATHRDLKALVAAGRFREDLLYRLRVIPVALPPLRTRPEDIPLLVAKFVEELSAGWGRTPPRVHDGVYRTLAARPWPGNVRELRNVVERAVILCTGEVLNPSDFGEEHDGRVPTTQGFTLPSEGIDVEQMVDGLVRQALERTKGNQSAAARLLHLSRDQIRYRMQRLGLLGSAET